MSLDPRVASAFKAMRSLGIEAAVVKPVLKKLLQLYNRQWEFIEEDNYRTLADAIFEAAVDKPLANKDHSRTMDEMEHSFKKPKLAFPEDQASSMMDNGNNYLNFGEGEIQETCESKPKKLLQLQSGVPETECCYQAMDRGKNLVLAEQSDQVLPNITSPASNTSPALSNSVDSFPSKPKPAMHLASQCPENIKQEGSSFDYRTNLQSIFDIISSSCGRVKLSLKCDDMSAQSNQCCPSINAVIKLVEDNYLMLYKSDGFQFSLKKLMKEICESYLELANEPPEGSPEKKSTASCLQNSMCSNREPLGVGNLERNSTKKASCSVSSSSPSLVSRQQPMRRDKKKAFKIYDITNGTEGMSISLLDEIGNGRRPKFSYIRENTIFQSAYVQFSLARIADDDCCSSCKGDCLLSSVPCACARETGGEFAYTSEGILREEFLRDCISMYQEPQKHYHFYCEDCPLERAKNTQRPEKCKGHLVRKFIKECWRKCGCKMGCGNRVVQRGITQKLQVFLTNDGKGWGVRALEELPKGAFVCEYVGEILTNIELYERNKRRGGNERHTYPVLLDADWGSEGVLKDEDALCLDATYFGNVARFINHRCSDANLIEIPVQIETPDHHYYHIAFFTNRKVNAFEELTWDYGIDFEDINHPIKAFKCCCGSPGCRDRKGKGIAPRNLQFKQPASRG